MNLIMNINFYRRLPEESLKSSFSSVFGLNQLPEVTGGIKNDLIPYEKFYQELLEIKIKRHTQTVVANYTSQNISLISNINGINFKEMKSIIKVYINNSPIILVAIYGLGFVYLNRFYSSFDIPIEQYIQLADILFLSINLLIALLVSLSLLFLFLYIGSLST